MCKRRAHVIVRNTVGEHWANRLVHKRFQLQQWLEIMKIGPGCPKDFLAANESDLPSAPEGAFCKKQRIEKDAWQAIHMEYYESSGVPWPPTRGALQGTAKGCEHLTDREWEVLVLANHLYPAPADMAPGQIQCIDINDDLRRHFGGIEYKPIAEAYCKDMVLSLRDPWKGPLIMTLVGSSHILVRSVAGMSFCLTRFT